MRPDVRTYSSVINACAYCKGGHQDRREALEIALRTFGKMGKGRSRTVAEPNAVTYGTILKAIHNLMPISAERDTLVSRIFERCCREGCVGRFVLTQLRQVAPELYLEIASKGGLTKEVRLDDLPSSWTKNSMD